MKNVLIFGAHPDDDILGAGGTMRYLKDQGYAVFVCMVTDGSSTQYKDSPALWQKKDKEHRQALDLLGAEDIIKLNFPDMKLDTISHAEVNKKMAEVVERVQPEIVFTHYGDDLNLDHKYVFLSTLIATRPQYAFIKAVYSYEVLSSTEWTQGKPFQPNYFVDISGSLKKKKQALSLMETEVRPYPHPRSPEGIDILARYRGFQCGKEFAEAFQVVKKYE